MKQKPKELRLFEPILSRNGYRYVRSSGSHFIYRNLNTHRMISVNKDLNRMVKERLVKEYELE